MSEKSYNHQHLTAYLLGSLAEAETEVFDELSITDDDFVEQLSAAEKDLIDAYLYDELSDDESEQFRSNYLTSPRGREKVAFARSFQIFAKKNLAPESAVEQRGEKTGFFSKFFTPPPFVLQWTVVATVLAVLLLSAWLFWQNSDFRPQVSQTESNREAEKLRPTENSNQPVNTENTPGKLDETPEKPSPQVNKTPRPATFPEKVEPKPVPSRPRVKPEEKLAQSVKKPRETPGVGMGTGFGSPAKIVTLILLPSRRSGTKLPILKLQPDTYAAKIELQLESDDFSRYRVILRNSTDDQAIWQSLSTSIKKGKNKILRIEISGSLLKSNIYSLEVLGISHPNTPEIIGNYSFRVVP